MKDRLSNLKINECVCYLPTENLTRQLKKNYVFDSLLSQLYEYQNDGLFFYLWGF